MRNLPDDELFNQVKARLQDFEEQPDDDTWGAIAASISTAEPGWIKGAEKLSLAFILLLLLGARYGGMIAPGNGVATHKTSKAEIQSSADRSGSATPFDTLSMNGQVPHLQRISAHNETVAGDEQVVSVPSTLDPQDTNSFMPPSKQNEMINARITMANVDGRTPKSAEQNIHHRGAIIGHHTADAMEPPRSTRGPSSKNIDRLSDERLVTHDTLQMNNSMLQEDRPSKEVEPIAADRIQDSASLSTVLPTHRARSKKSGVRFYALATPSLTFVDVAPSTSDAATFQKLNSPGIFSKERLSATFEAGAQALVARRLMIFAGLSYFQKSMDLSLEQMENGPGSFTPSGSLGFDFQPKTTTTIVQYRQQNIGATVGLAYVVSLGKIVHQMGGSLQYEHGILHRSTDEKTSKNFLSYRLFYRAEYGLNERLSIFIQPTFFRSLISHDAMGGGIQIKQSRAGVGLGVVYRIKN